MNGDKNFDVLGDISQRSNSRDCGAV
jgi:hypothetical protein